MSKLFKLKDWLTIPDTAKHLSGVLEEEVGDADVLQMGLDGHLKISAHFVNGCVAIKTKRIPVEQARSVPSLDGKHTVILGTPIAPGEVLEFDNEICYIASYAVFDLPMIRGEICAVQQICQRLTGGPLVEMSDIHGVFVANSFGDLFQIQADAADHPKAKIMAYGKERNDPTRYYPASRLPDDAVLVVRTEALRELEKSIAGKSSSLPIPLAATERHMLLKQIGALSLALAEQSKKYKRGEKPNGLQIANFAGEIIDALPGANTAGLGVSSVRESIRQGIELLNAIQQ
jgi:hypothetical protein